MAGTSIIACRMGFCYCEHSTAVVRNHLQEILKLFMQMFRVMYVQYCNMYGEVGRTPCNSGSELFSPSNIGGVRVSR